jgi:O-antigen biosynthesis protein
LLEFTGERVVPGLVDPSLLHEHRARYRFAAYLAKRFGPEAAILDAGCGTGYGIEEFADISAQAGSVTAFDISAEAIGHARDNFAGPRVRLLQAACQSLPFADGSFDLIVAFEVIEHLERWREMLGEAKRVLKTAGVLLVSTPNKTYYAESRAGAGPNPFHVREFDLSEFSSALEEVFPHVTMWAQNHVEGLGFIPAGGPPAPGVLDAPEDQEPENAYFFLAACSQQPFDCAESFAYIPQSGNVLRDREHHVALLQSELEKKNAWLAQMEAEHLSLNRAHRELLAELQEHNAWAARLNEDLAQSGARVVELQDEIGAANRRFQEHIAALDRQAEERLIWIRDLEAQILSGREEIERLNRENAWVRVKFEERTEWGESKAREVLRLTDEWHNLTAEVARLKAIVASVDESKWMRLGRAVHLAPEVPGQR